MAKSSTWVVVTIVLSVIIGFIVISLIFFPSPSPSPLVTPSQMSSIMGGTWRIGGIGATGFKEIRPYAGYTILIGNITAVQLTNGEEISAVGEGEYLIGVINGSYYNASLTLCYFESPYEALAFFDSQTFLLGHDLSPKLNASVVVLSNNEAVVYTYNSFLHFWVSRILSINGNSVKEVQVFGPTKIPQTKLEEIISLI